MPPTLRKKLRVNYDESSEADLWSHYNIAFIQETSLDNSETGRRTKNKTETQVKWVPQQEPRFTAKAARGTASQKRPASPSPEPRRAKTKSKSKKSGAIEIEDPTGLSPTGSPFDPTPRRILDVDDLDLDRSYVDDYAAIIPTEKDRPARQKRWKHKGPEPLTDVTKLPEGWNTKEPDLDKDDIDGQIARSRERIQDNILPAVFEERLKQYQEMKAQRDKQWDGEDKAHSWEVIQRINGLKRLILQLRNGGDPYEELPNVIALLRAYRLRQLDWHANLVTYWSKGKQLCQPRPFDWDEFEAINEKHEGYKAFWVEGNREPGPSAAFACNVTYENPAVFGGMLMYDIAFRLPKKTYWDTLEFLFDTGCSNFRMFENDITMIAGNYRSGPDPEVPIWGYSECKGASGDKWWDPVVVLEGTILDKNGKRMTPWSRIDISFSPGSYNGSMPRLDGRWTRFKLFTATAPSTPMSFYMATSKRSLENYMPKVKWEDRSSPNIIGGLLHPNAGDYVPLGPVTEEVKQKAAKGAKAFRTKASQGVPS